MDIVVPTVPIGKSVDPGGSLLFIEVSVVPGDSLLSLG